MAGYTILGTRPDLEFLGGTRTKPVMVVSVVTQEHGVYFETRIDTVDYTADVARQNANGFTIIYELLFQIPGVSDVGWAQEATPAGQLQDHVIVYVSSSSGQSSGIVDVPYSQFTQDIIAGKVKTLRAELDATEGAG
jgi:hypothetical protein